MNRRVDLAGRLRRVGAALLVGGLTSCGGSPGSPAGLDVNLTDAPVVFALVDTDTANQTTFPRGVTGTTMHLSLANAAIARLLVQANGLNRRPS